MNASRLAPIGIGILYAAIAVATLFVLTRPGVPFDRVVLDVLLATIPMALLAAITWRLVWPRWKLVAKVLLHPCIYAILSVYIGHWSVVIAWIHQGVLGLGGHIWFSRKHGFTWYAVEDPERYVALSKEMVGALPRADP